MASLATGRSCREKATPSASPPATRAPPGQATSTSSSIMSHLLSRGSGDHATTALPGGQAVDAAGGAGPDAVVVTGQLPEHVHPGAVPDDGRGDRPVAAE